MEKPLNPAKDLQINTRDLTQELTDLSVMLFRYYEKKADFERDLDMAKFALKETKGRKYKEFKNGPTKTSDAGVEAAIDSDQEVMLAQKAVADANHALNTWWGAVDSMKAKKDALIQLAADRRKEV